MQRARPLAPPPPPAAAIAHLALGAPPAFAAKTTTDDLTVGGAAIHVEFEPLAFRDGGDAVAGMDKPFGAHRGRLLRRFPTTRVTVRVIAEGGDRCARGQELRKPRRVHSRAGGARGD